VQKTQQQATADGLFVISDEYAATARRVFGLSD